MFSQGYCSPVQPLTFTESEDYNFVDKLQERYTCLICSGVQEQPVLVPCCGQHFCDSCLQKWFRKQGTTCPHCRLMGITSMANKQQQRDINELRVFCSNKKRGCTWIGTIGSFKNHIGTKLTTLPQPVPYGGRQLTCQYEQIDCPNKCKMRIARNALNKHMKQNCLCRKYSCEHCGLRGTFHTITGECGVYGPCDLHGDGHHSQCQSFPLECPNKCSKIVKRKEIVTHREICPLERVECSFSEVDCTEKMPRKDISEHEAMSDHQHLILVMKAFKDLKQKVASLEEKTPNEDQHPLSKASPYKPRNLCTYPFEVQAFDGTPNTGFGGPVHLDCRQSPAVGGYTIPLNFVPVNRSKCCFE